MKINGVIFDLDGTLLDTLVTLADSYNTALAALGFPIHPPDAYRQFVGDGARKCVERCLPANSEAEVVDQCLAKQQGIYADSWKEGTRIYPHINELLEQLTSHKIKLGVLSNKDDAFTKILINHFFSPETFASVQGYSEEIELKPHPAGALKVASSMKLDTNELAIIGDSKMDIQTALACNMVPIGVSWGFREVEELRQAGAKHILMSPLDLLNLNLLQKH